MITTIKKNLADFLAVVGVIVLGLAIGVYVLAQQRVRFPLVEKPFYTVKAEHDHAHDREEVGEVLLDRGDHPPAFFSLISRRWYAARSLATSGRALSTKSCAPLIMSVGFGTGAGGFTI